MAPACFKHDGGSKRLELWATLPNAVWSARPCSMVLDVGATSKCRTRKKAAPGWNRCAPSRGKIRVVRRGVWPVQPRKRDPSS